MNSRDSILVTGAAGMIGSALVWALNQRGHQEILITDRLGHDEKWRNLVPLRFSDYLDADALFGEIERGRLNSVRTIYHLGAVSATTERDSALLMENNFRYTARLAQWALEGGRRFVYASSAATYGDGAHGMSDSTENLRALRPLNMYGYSKHLFDLHAHQHGWLDQIVGLKYFNVFGPNEDHKAEMRSVVHKAYQQILDDGRVKLFKSTHPDYEDGCQMRDFLYVKDAVEMTIHLAETPTATGLFNLGAGAARTWIELVTPIFRALDRTVEIEMIEMPESLRAKYQNFTMADTTRLHESGYPGPQFSLETAVEDYVKHYLINDLRLGDESIKH